MNSAQLAVLGILDNAYAYKWTVQGFGMLRMYIRNIGRLHIWTTGLRYPGVSMIHNHSWDLKSEIIFGQITNTRYSRFPHFVPVHPGESSYHERRLVTGHAHEWVTEERPVMLMPASEEKLFAGDVYHQRAKEVHQTIALDGTVTLMHRNEDVRGEAEVYWPYGTEWGTAQPRDATAADITVGVLAVQHMLDAYGITL